MGEKEKTVETHGVSSMTRHTHAMVLRQSVVSSIGKVLFWNVTAHRTRDHRYIGELRVNHTLHIVAYWRLVKELPLGGDRVH